MDTSELYRITLKAVLNTCPRGTQTRIADDLGLDRSHFNAFLNGRRSFSETKREQIAKWLGYSYIDFLIMGREVQNLREKAQKAGFGETFSAKDYSVQVLIDKGYSVVTEMLEAINPDSDISISFSAGLKAKLIRIDFEFRKRDSDRIDEEYELDEKKLADCIEFLEGLPESLLKKISGRLAPDFRLADSKLIKFMLSVAYISSEFFESVKEVKENEDEKAVCLSDYIASHIKKMQNVFSAKTSKMPPPPPEFETVSPSQLSACPVN